MTTLDRSTPDARDVSQVTYTITELAQEFAITPRALRFYEDMGLLPPARAGRHLSLIPI